MSQRVRGVIGISVLQALLAGIGFRSPRRRNGIKILLVSRKASEFSHGLDPLQTSLHRSKQQTNPCRYSITSSARPSSVSGTVRPSAFAVLKVGHELDITPNYYQVLQLLNSNRIPDANFVRVEWREIATSAEAEWTTTKECAAFGVIRQNTVVIVTSR